MPGKRSHACATACACCCAPRLATPAYASPGRRLFWTALATVFVAGVVLPWLLPEPMRRLDRALLSAPTPSTSASAATQALPPGTRLRDCRDDTCPWLVVLPAGRFTMGSPAGEAGRYDDEGPQHEVTIARKLAVMEAEVTRAQYAAFVDETGYRPQEGCYTLNQKGDNFELDASRDWSTPGFDQTPQHPVTCVNWNDGQAYAQWLSKRTGQRYRLLSEAEWEYAARAGSTTRYSFGDSDSDLCSHGNVFDRSAVQGTKALPAFKRLQVGRLHRWLRLHRSGAQLPVQRLGPVRHARQRLGMGAGLRSRQ